MEWKYTNIPKIIHFYWDKSPLSFLNLLSVKSFKELNPDWVVKLYEPKIKHDGISWIGHTQKDKYVNINYLQYVYKYCDEIIEVDLEKFNFRNDVSEVYKSDFLRWYLLSTEGGLWSDMDVLYLKPMHTLDLSKYINFGNNENLDLTICEESEQYNMNYLIGFLLASKNNEFYANISKKAANAFNSFEYQSIGNKLIRNLYPDIFDIECLHPKMSIANIPLNIVYPYNYRDLSNLYKTNDEYLITDETIGIHWYNAESMTKEYCNKLDLNNLGDSIMDRFISQYADEYKNVKSDIITPTITTPKLKNKFIIVIPMYNANKLGIDCIKSIIDQDFEDLGIIIRDDISTDGTDKLIEEFLGINDNNLFIRKIQGKDVLYIKNNVKYYPVGNTYDSVINYVDNNDAIIGVVDGDDALYSSQAVKKISEAYLNNPGKWLIWSQHKNTNGTLGVSRPLPPDSIIYSNRNYWSVTHFRTNKAFLYKKLNINDLLDPFINNSYYTFAGDAAFLFPFIEMCGNEHSLFIDEPLYLYNNELPLNEHHKSLDNAIKYGNHIRNNGRKYKKLDNDIL